MTPEDTNQKSGGFDQDTELMLSVKEGNALAFEELMTRNQSRVHSLLVHFIGDRDLAEDLTQETFLRVYRVRESYKPTAKFSTWLFKIVHNIAVNALRNRKRHPEVPFSGASKPSDAGTSGEFSLENNILAKSGFLPTRHYDNEEKKEMVHLALKVLPPRQRAVLLYHHFEDMTYEQIAEVMDLTGKAVKSIACRGRQRLYQILSQYFEKGKAPS